MHRITSAMVASMIMAVGAAAIAQPGSGQPGSNRPGNNQPESTPGLTRQPPGQQRTPPGQERTRGHTPQLQIDPDTLRQVISSWPQESQKAAQETMQKYGPPNGFTPTELIWENNGPWKKTVVSAEPWDHHFPMEHKDVLTNVIKYKVPVDQFDELARFDGSVIAYRTPGELAARCDKEEMNFLALNLAHEVVTGKRTVEDARQFLAQTAKEFKEGKSSTYTQGLMFEIETNTGDPDKATPSGGMTGQDPAKRPTQDDGTQPSRTPAGTPPATSPGGTQPGSTQPGTPTTPRNPR
jgi:hypothetical protein